jgi:hypothetical protein
MKIIKQVSIWLGAYVFPYFGLFYITKDLLRLRLEISIIITSLFFIFYISSLFEELNKDKEK